MDRNQCKFVFVHNEKSRRSRLVWDKIVSVWTTEDGVENRNTEVLNGIGLSMDYASEILKTPSKLSKISFEPNKDGSPCIVSIAIHCGVQAANGTFEIDHNAMKEIWGSSDPLEEDTGNSDSSPTCIHFGNAKGWQGVCKVDVQIDAFECDGNIRCLKNNIAIQKC